MLHLPIIEELIKGPITVRVQLFGRIRSFGSAMSNTASTLLTQLVNYLLLHQMIAQDSGCCSYLAGSGKEFILVDPLVDVERFMQKIPREGGKILGVIDTHVHADHISGSREIQKLNACPIYMYETSPVKFPFVPLTEEKYHMAHLNFRVLHTPGHAPEHVCLLIDNKVVLTGDTLLVGDVGRTDLGRGDPTQLYDSIFNKLLTLEDRVEVLPGHVGKAHFVSGDTSSTIGLERRTNPALKTKARKEFLRYMREGWPPKPAHYKQYIKMNSGLMELRDAQF
jgi:hydroxyacylglutathione hydrolase